MAGKNAAFQNKTRRHTHKEDERRMKETIVTVNPTTIELNGRRDSAEIVTFPNKDK